MLQAIRTKAASIVVRILFLLLVASFAIWGIGDYTFLRRSDPKLATVGSTSISRSEYTVEYRRESERLRRLLGQLEPEQARALGLPDQVLERMIGGLLLDQELSRLGILIGTETVREQILKDPAFRGPSGSFDRYRYQRLLQENGFSEPRFVDLLRHDLARTSLTRAIEGGAAVPAVLAERIYRYRNERRQGVALLIDNASVGEVGEPDAAAIQAYYEEHTEAFQAPEYRALLVVRIGVDELMSEAEVTEAQLKEEYESRKSEFGKPERREIEQILFQDQAAADAAKAKLDAGTAFEEVAKEAGQTPDVTKLGLFGRNDFIAPEVGAAAFALAEGQVTQPVKSPLGWHLMKVARIEAGRDATFDEVKERLTTELKRRAAEEILPKVGGQLEDALASGNDLAAAAAKLGLKPLEVPAIDIRGRNPKGESVPKVSEAREVLSVAFDTAEGRDSPTVETPDGSLYVVKVQRLTPAQRKPVDEVRTEIVTRWKAEQQAEAARKRAEEILARAKSEDLATVATSYKLQTTETTKVKRNAGTEANATVAPELVARLFALSLNEVGIAASAGGQYVVKLTLIEGADPAADAEGMTQLRRELERTIAGDLVSEFTVGLRRRLGVEIDRQAVDQTL